MNGLQAIGLALAITANVMAWSIYFDWKGSR